MRLTVGSHVRIESFDGSLQRSVGFRKWLLGRTGHVSRIRAADNRIVVTLEGDLPRGETTREYVIGVRGVTLLDTPEISFADLIGPVPPVRRRPRLEPYAKVVIIGTTISGGRAAQESDAVVGTSGTILYPAGRSCGERYWYVKLHDPKRRVSTERMVFHEDDLLLCGDDAPLD